MSYFSQNDFSVRLEWGAAAIRHLAPDVDCVIVIDIMSFSTCVSIAVERGADVYPYPWRDETSLQYGAERGALVANSKRHFAESWSLSPQSMLQVPVGLKLVLPSPNGSACSYQAKGLSKVVYCASFRNLRATAAACRRYRRILVVPCGERWPGDDGLRPSFEDYLAAGGIASALDRRDASPEARAAALAYDGLGTQRRSALEACSSALELTERGFAVDVALCLEEDVSRVACRLDGDRFVAEQME
ncbi:MAG: 2-phosphosulfolactate phosphatase [Burkholderiaceae bacterium]